MKKVIPFVCLLALSAFAVAQAPLQPGKKAVDQGLIQNTSYVMNWYMLRDTAKTAFGKVKTTIQKQGKKLLVETNVELRGMSGRWVDTTIADLATLKPLYHSSYNMQREMALNYNKKIVSGYHLDKLKKNKRTDWLDTTGSACFDSNLYPVLIGWLPLKEGYTRTIRIYNFDPAGRSGEMNAFVKDVKSVRIRKAGSAETDAWAVTVNDETGNGENGTSVYYFEKDTRQLLRQEITVGKRQMLMELTTE